MSNIIFTRGIQGSGKSTWAKEFCDKNIDWVRISRDDIRNMRGKYWIPKDEPIITQMEDRLIITALKTGKRVIVDAMNLDKGKALARVNKWSDELGHPLVFEFKDFTGVPLETCIERDLKRPNSIGEKVIRDTWERHLAPEPVVYSEDSSLPRAIICDIDGTLTKMSKRSPYDWHKVRNDELKYQVAEVLSRFASTHRIILMTGRDGCALHDTVIWLDDHSIHYDELYIRPAGNSEKDSIIKKRLFEDNIRGKLYVDFVLDDRNQVVDMWRKELGLMCLQVNYGDF